MNIILIIAGIFLALITQNLWGVGLGVIFVAWGAMRIENQY